MSQSGYSMTFHKESKTAVIFCGDNNFMQMFEAESRKWRRYCQIDISRHVPRIFPFLVGNKRR